MKVNSPVLQEVLSYYSFNGSPWPLYFENLFFHYFKPERKTFATSFIDVAPKQKRAHSKEVKILFQTVCRKAKLNKERRLHWSVSALLAQEAKSLSRLPAGRPWTTQELLHRMYWKSVARRNRNLHSFSSYLLSYRMDSCEKWWFFQSKVAIPSK